MFNKKINQRLDEIEKAIKQERKIRLCSAQDHRLGKPIFNEFCREYQCFRCGATMSKYACETWLENKKEEIDSFFKE